METAKLIWMALEKDPDGFAVEKECTAEIYVIEKSVARAEYYESMRAGIKVQRVFEVRQEDYELSLHMVNGRKSYATRIQYDGEDYDIIRTYSKDKSHLEIICK